MSGLAGGGTLCAMAALVLLVVSTATDYWMQYRYSGNFANQGLWRFCINRKCHAHTLLGCHACVHAAVRAEFLCRRPAGPGHPHVLHQEQEGAVRGHRLTAGRIPFAVSFGNLHWGDHSLLWPAVHQLDVLVVLHRGLDWTYFGADCWNSPAVCLPEEDV